jgi:hypothetical protein
MHFSMPCDKFFSAALFCLMATHILRSALPDDLDPNAGEARNLVSISDVLEQRILGDEVFIGGFE